ncbi:hypothetical protein NAL32_20535 [Chryseobacterium sp. Ch-15]|nr:hypothetical protein [Chryseobacterium muglaense]MBD3907089.1 hypothetical protein [Chryseobacterium muglaense]MCC9036539.1 hypothetical protein [Chryseobacterium muglaense]MCM2556781.1 hypothetical protein [Chryseobacterium muglaense]
MYKDIMAYLSDGGSSLSPWMQSNVGGYQPLNKSTLLSYVSNLYPGLSTGALQQKAGSLFENAFNAIMGIDYSSLNYESNDLKIAGMYKNRARNTIPDGVFDLVRDNYYSVEVGNFNIPTPFPKSSTRYSGAQFAEVKAMDGTLYSSSNTGQISSMIYSMSRNNGVKDYGGQFIIGTTADTIISPRIIAEGAAFGIQVIQMTAQYRMVSGAMQIRFYYGGPSPSSAFIR